jgi:hypothetical protein
LTSALTTNIMLAEAHRRNLTDPTRFAITGNDQHSDGGFVMLSSYLLTHPALSPQDLRVLQYLIYRAESYEALANCRVIASSASAEELTRELHLDDKTSRKSLQRLEAYGLIGRDRSSKRHTFLLLPGPWPLLGDRPQRGQRWQDFFIFGDLAKQVTAYLAERGGAMGEFLKVKKGSQKIDSEQGKNSREDTGTFENQGNFYPPISSVNTDVHKLHNTSSTQNTRTASRVRAVSNKEIRDIDSPESGRTPCGAAPRHDVDPGELPQAVPPDTTGQDRGQRQDPRAGAVVGNGGTFSSKLPTQPASAAKVIEEHAGRTPVRPQNPVSFFRSRYRQRVETDYDILLARFTAKQTRQVSQAVNRYGAERTLAALEWVFDNWTAIKAQDGKIYAGDKFPPLRALTAANLMDRYMPYIDAGERYGTSSSDDSRYIWEGWVKKSIADDPEADSEASIEALRKVWKK